MDTIFDHTMPLQEAARLVRERCKAALLRKYGTEWDPVIVDRMTNEDQDIEEAALWKHFLLASDIADVCAEQGSPVFARGALGSSLFAYLLGVTEHDPLLPHLYCPNCKKQEFVSLREYPTVVDLNRCDSLKKTCPVCGAKRIADGYDLSWETFFHVTAGSRPAFEMDVAQEVLPLLSQRFGEALNVLSFRVRGSKSLSVLRQMGDAGKVFDGPFVPGEEEIGRFIEEGLNDSDEKLFPPQLPPTAIPQSFFELIRLYGLVYGTGTWEANRKQLSDPDDPYRDVLALREDVQRELFKHSVSFPVVPMIANEIGKGNWGKGGYESETAKRIYGFTDEDFQRFRRIRFLFPKAHAIGQILLRLRLQRCRDTHPVEYYAARLSVEARGHTDANCFMADRERIVELLKNCADGGEKALFKTVLECLDRDIEFLPADPEASDPHDFLPGKGTIRLPSRFAQQGIAVPPFFRPITDLIGEAAARALSGEVQTPVSVREALFPSLSEGLYLIGGRPGVGKTTLLWKLAAELAATGTPVYLYSAERISRTAAERLRTLLGADARQLPIRVADGPIDLETLLRMARREIPSGVLLLDGIEPLFEKRAPYPAANPYSETHLGEATAAVLLKEFAKQCRLPLIVTVPLSRDVELRADRRPTLSDVRCHRRFVDEADKVVLLYRDSCCHDGGDPALQYRIAKDAPGSAEPWGWRALDNMLKKVR